MQRVPDKGWEGRRTGMRSEENKGNGNKQTEGYKHGNVGEGGINNRYKRSDQLWQAGERAYKQGTQRETGAAQTTLRDFWKGKEKDMRSWSQEMEELDDLDNARAKDRQESAISYV